MPRFFIRAEQVSDGVVTLVGDDAHHISRSLRMAQGEKITVCDMQGKEYACELVSFLPDCVTARVIEERQSDTEPCYKVRLFQALPKGDKLDSIIQKAVECGVSEIYPFESERCVVRVKDGAEEKKQERRQRIALEAAKQCGRGIVPSVHATVSFSRMLELAKDVRIPLFCYEGDGTVPLPSVIQEGKNACRGEMPTISIVIGSEGGFSIDEASRAKAAGLIPVGLGKRILRTETAASFVLACIAYELELSEKP